MYGHLIAAKKVTLVLQPFNQTTRHKTPEMQLTVHQDDANMLLSEKNILSEPVLDKYRTAGQIVQTTLKYLIQLINDSYHLGKTERPYSLQELCVLGDSMTLKLLNKSYTNTDKVREKGLAHPVTIDVNEYVANVSPELDLQQHYTFSPGDVVTISTGAHIDGYTALVSHTVVIYPPGVMIDNQLKPEGPLLGPKADSMVASYIATEATVALLGLALTPEKLSVVPGLNGASNITGAHIRELVDGIAESFGCVVVPGSKVRRIRRFLAGQAEGIVAERDFKGVVWSESDQETNLLKKTTNDQSLIVHDNKEAAHSTQTSLAIPSDEFVIEAGEVYNIDIRMCSVRNLEKGLVTLEDVDDYKNEMARQTIHIRDFAITHLLKLKSARKLLNAVDKNFSVYPFKLTYMCESFPVDHESGDAVKQLEEIKKEIKVQRLGLSELSNRYLTRAKPVQRVKLIPLLKILTTDNKTGRHGIDATKLTLPGREVPLPALGVSALKLKSLLKHGSIADAISRESTTIVLNNASSNNVVRLTGGNQAFKPSWVHSQFQVGGLIQPTVEALSQLVQDSRFGIKIKEIQPYKLNEEVLHLTETMQLD